MSQIPFSGRKGAKTPKRTADNLFSNDIVEALFGISEGPIMGLKDGAKTFMIGDTPLQSVDGNNNFDAFELVIRKGSELGEDIVSRAGGFGASTNVNTELATNVPITRQALRSDIDYLDIRLVVNRLSKDTDKGSFEHTGKVKIEWKPRSQPNWRPINTQQSNPVPASQTGLSWQSFFSDVAPNYNKVSPGDRPVHWVSTPPITTANASLWFIRDGSNHPHSWNGSSWVPIPGAQRFEGNSWVWSEESSWGADKLTRAWVMPGDQTPAGREQGDYWLHQGSGIVYFFNGSTWIIAGSSLTPGNFGTGGGVTISNGEIAITGKTTTPFVKEFRIPLGRAGTGDYNGTVDPNADPIDIRVTKTSPNNTTEEFFDITWESFQEITAKTFNFPGLATAQVVARASEQFSSMPEFSGIYQGRIIRVPSNYDPVTRTYAGNWDGVWKLAYSNNPAYVANDLVMNDRYGMNAYYPVTLNKWDVYEAGRWCDVRTAQGQPRFTFNSLLSDPRGGRETINYICGIFGGRFFDDGNGSAVIKLDQPTTPVATFAPENVVDGLFAYTFTEISSRHNDLTVSFINPALNWQQDRRRVYDQSHINKYGRIPYNFVAVGCTSPEEAILRARYLMATGLTETRMVKFKTNRQGLYLSPYDIILVADDEMAAGLSGRIKERLTSTSFSLRDPIFLEPGFSYRVAFTVPNPETGTFQVVKRDLVAGSVGEKLTINLKTELPPLPDNALFTIETTDDSAAPRPFRVTSIDEIDGDPDNVEINAIIVNRLKWAFVDGNVGDVDDLITRYEVKTKEKPAPIPDLRVRGGTGIFGTKTINIIKLDWDPSPSTLVQNYRVYVSRDNDAFVLIGETSAFEFEWRDVLPGEYIFQVTALSMNGMESTPVTIEHRLIGDYQELSAPSNLRMINGVSETVYDSRSPAFTWDRSTHPQHREYVVQIKKLDGTTLRTVSTTEPTFQYEHSFNFVDGGGRANRAFSLSVADKDQFGFLSPFTTLAVNNPAPARPTGIQIEQIWNSANVTLDRPAITDFGGVVIHMSQVDGFVPGSDTLVYSGPNTSVTIALMPPLTYYFRVGVFDTFGTDDVVFSDQLTLMTDTLAIDTTPPAVPTNFKLTSAITDGVVRLVATWNANVETDLLGYDLELREANGNWVGFSTNTNVYELVNVRANQTFAGRVRAKDKTGNMSAFSSVFTITAARDTVAPAVPSGLVLQAGFAEFWITVTPNTEPDFAAYEFYEADSATPAPTAATPASFESRASVIARTGLNMAATKHYWVRAVDTSGNKSAWSARKQATTAGLTTANIQSLIDATSFKSGPIAIPQLSIIDLFGKTVFGADGKIGNDAYLTLDGNQVRISDVASNSLTPSIHYVGESATAPTQVLLGSDWRQNAVYKNSTDGVSYILTGMPLAWEPYLTDGKMYVVTIESTNGSIFRVGQATQTVLKARVFKNGAEVTDQIPDTWFQWRRVSLIPRPAPNDDATWNALYTSGYKQVNISVDSVYARATFFVDIISR